MKKLIGILLVVVTLTGCQQVLDEVTDDEYGDRYSGISLYYGDFSSIRYESGIAFWINSHIHYQASSHLQTLAECVASGHGDCEEKALMYLNIMYIVFHKKGELCVVSTSDRKIEAGGQDSNHAVVRYNGIIIEPATGRPTNYNVHYSYSFDHIFK